MPNEALKIAEAKATASMKLDFPMAGRGVNLGFFMTVSWVGFVWGKAEQVVIPLIAGIQFVDFPEFRLSPE
jgi:hypothetical protein